jgi:branched-chain amino acid aminotransferase
MKNNKVFFNGKFVAEKDAVVSIKTHALHYGTGCFEGIRAYYNEAENCLFVFRIEEHYKRFLNSAKTLFIKIGYSEKELVEITKDLLVKNFEKTDIYIRPLAYKADPAVGNFVLPKLADGLSIYTVPLGRYGSTSGIKTQVSTWRRVSDMSIPPRAKITGSYVNTALAKTEAVLNGYDEALLLDMNGHIVEGSAENIFVLKDGVALTPPVHDDILVGITRDTIIMLLQKELNIEVIQRSIDRSEIYSADEVFLVGTGAEVLPVLEVDKRQIGNMKIGKVTKKVSDIYFSLAHGTYGKYNEFLTKISAPKGI